MKQIKVNPNNEQFYSKEFIRGFNLGAERQYEADIADMPKWTPCSVRLPEKEGRYLCTNDMWGGWITSINVWLGDRWLCPNEKPIAWMPLPKEWKGENDG